MEEEKKKVALDTVVLLSVFVKSQKQLVWVQLGVQLWYHWIYSGMVYVIIGPISLKASWKGTFLVAKQEEKGK